LMSMVLRQRLLRNHQVTYMPALMIRPSTSLEPLWLTLIMWPCSSQMGAWGTSIRRHKSSLAPTINWGRRSSSEAVVSITFGRTPQMEAGQIHGEFTLIEYSRPPFPDGRSATHGVAPDLFWFYINFHVANTLPKFIKIGLLRSEFLLVDFLFAAAFLLRFLAKGGDFQSRKSGPRKSLFSHSQCGGQGFDPPLLHQLLNLINC